MEETLSLREFFVVLKKRMGLIVLLTVLAVIFSGVISYMVLTPVYETSTQILVNQEQTESVAFSRQNIQTDLELINTYSVIIKSPVILETVIEQLELNLSVEALNDKVAVNNTENSQVVSVSVQDPDPAIAVDIANTTAAVFESEIQKLMNVDNVSILSPAVLKDDPSPIAPNPILNIIIGAVVGMALGVGIAFLLEYLDTTIKSGEDIEEFLDLPRLGIISPITDNGPAEFSIASKRERG